MSDWERKLDAYRAQLRELQPSDPPEPWTTRTGIAVGGLEYVGFVRSSELLLVVSSQGRGLLDCEAGELVARDRSTEDVDGWLDERNLEAEGIGVASGSMVRLAGLGGGALPLWSGDGWVIEIVAPDWPNSGVVLVGEAELQPWTMSIQSGELPSCTLLLPWDVTPHAAGFSASGRSLVVATSSDVHVWGR